MTDHPPIPVPPADEVDWDALASFLAGESSAGDAAAMQRWLSARPDRAELVAALDGMMKRTGYREPAGLDVEAALGRLHERMHEPAVLDMQTMRDRRRANEPSRAWRWQTAAAVAAVALIVIGVKRFVLGSPDAPTVAAAPQQLRTAVGQRDSLTLSDGSRVVLGPASELTVGANYGTGAREVSVRGNAYFEVKHDAAHPFSVRTGGALIEDIGTAFAVHSDSGDDVQVSVREGAVQFRSTTATGGAPVVLHAGDRGTLDLAGAVNAHVGGATADDLAWTNGALVFRDAPISKVRADFRRWYGVDLRVADSALARRHVTAAFTRETAKQALDVIALALGASYDLRGDTALLRSGPTHNER